MYPPQFRSDCAPFAQWKSESILPEIFVPRIAKGDFDEYRRPNYHSARHARPIIQRAPLPASGLANRARTRSAPLFISRAARLFLLFWHSRIDRSSDLEQGTRTDFRPYGVNGRHGPRRIDGGLASGRAWIGGRSERWARPIALCGLLELGVAASAEISFAGLAGVRAAYVAAYP